MYLHLGNLGAFRQGVTQSQLQADAQAARTGAFEPMQRLDQYGAGLGRLAGFGSTPATIRYLVTLVHLLHH